MTLEEKRKALKEYCNGRLCSGCPLVDTDTHCYNDDEAIDEHYKIVFGKSEPEQKQDDGVTSPSHYKIGKYECIEEMIEIFGVEWVKIWCRLNIYKYRYRHTDKDGQKDIDKAGKYMDILKELGGADGCQ